MTEETTAYWLASRNGRRVGHTLGVLGLVLCVLADGVKNGGHFAYALGGALGYAAMVGIGCYLIAIAKPLSNSRLHPGIFGIAMVTLGVYQWVS
jgi:hypothetical protein